MNKAIVVKEKECKRCGHKWIPRLERNPVLCPKCKSAYWNIDRTRVEKENK